MDIHMDAADAALVVDMLLSQRRSQGAIANLMHTTDAEKQLARLKQEAATRTIARIREALEVKR